jgi:hypothetical protein
MKQAPLVMTALAVLVAGNVAIAVACDQSKKTKTSASAASVSASATDSYAGCSHSGAAAAMSSSGACTHSSSAKGVSASAACSDKSTKSASAGKEGCAGHGMTTAAGTSGHSDCDACVDMASCEEALQSAMATTQVVALKNGVMYVYTADTPTRVRAVQAAMTKRNEHMLQFTTAGERAHLCGSCKEMRGAAASGKLTREFVNIEGGCLTLVTSNDPTVVAKLHAMAGITTASKVKS